MAEENPWREALTHHGYNPDHAPRGVTGDPAFAYQTPDGIWLRNWVCELDGISIDGHHPSEDDPAGPCLLCGKDPEEWV